MLLLCMAFKMTPTTSSKLFQYILRHVLHIWFIEKRVMDNGKILFSGCYKKSPLNEEGFLTDIFDIKRFCGLF